MANVKKGQYTRAPQWWKHLREWKGVFWGQERQAAKKDIEDQILELTVEDEYCFHSDMKSWLRTQNRNARQLLETIDPETKSTVLQKARQSALAVQLMVPALLRQLEK